MLCCRHPPAPGTCTIAAAVLRVSNLHHYVMNLLELGKNREKRQMICMFVKKTFVQCHRSDPGASSPNPTSSPARSPSLRKRWEALLAGWARWGQGNPCWKLGPPDKNPAVCLCISSLRFAPTTKLDLHHVPQPHPSTHRWPFPLPATPASHLPPPEKVSRPLATFESASPLTSPKLATQPYLRRARSACPLLSSQARSCKC